MKNKIISIIVLILLPISIIFFWMTTQSFYWIDRTDEKTNRGSFYTNCSYEPRMVVFPWLEKLTENREIPSYRPLLWNFAKARFEMSDSWQQSGVNNIGEFYPRIRCYL